MRCAIYYKAEVYIVFYKEVDLARANSSYYFESNEGASFNITISLAQKHYGGR